MSSWFSCCCGSRKALPEEGGDPVVNDDVVARLTPPLTGRLLGSTVSAASASERAILTFGSPDPLQPYLYSGSPTTYRSMEGHVRKLPSPTKPMMRQTTAPIIQTSSAKVEEPASVPIPFSRHASSSSIPTLVQQATMPILYEPSPLQRSSTETSEPPTLARSVSVVSQPDPVLDLLQRQNRSLDEQLQTVVKKNNCLEKESAATMGELEKERQKKQDVEKVLEKVQKEHLLSLQRNASLEKRLAEAREKILKIEGSTPLLKTPLGCHTERRGSLSDIEEEEGESSIDSDKMFDALELRKALAKKRGQYQRATGYIKIYKATIENLQRENNRLEMELEKQADRAKELEARLAHAEQSLEKREQQRLSIEKREVEVEKEEEHQEKVDAQKRELEQQIQKQELLLQEQRECLKTLSVQKETIVERLQQSEEAMHKSVEKMQELDKNITILERLVVEEREKNKKQKKEIQELGTKLKVVGEQLTEATVLLAGYELPKQSSSSLKRSASMPLQYEKSS